MDKSNWELSTQGGLSNVAPTVLELMGIRKPETMHASSLLIKEHQRVFREPESAEMQGVA
jgi:2,3-bisphosphoglycerate-independent phosphoglycerate mutase